MNKNFLIIIIGFSLVISSFAFTSEGKINDILWGVLLFFGFIIGAAGLAREKIKQEEEQDGEKNNNTKTL